MGSKQVKNFLKKMREDRNMTQEHLAEASGVTRYIISDFENGKRRPSPRTISRLAEALNCNYLDLMKGGESDELETVGWSENRHQYLLDAINLTQKHCGGKGFDEKMMMKISGYLGYLIEEYEVSSNHKKKEIIQRVEEQKAQMLANEIFLKTKKPAHEN